MLGRIAVLGTIGGGFLFLCLCAALNEGQSDERALIEFFKRRRPADFATRPKFPYPYDYLYASLLQLFPEMERKEVPKDSREFHPLKGELGTPEGALRNIVLAWREGKPELIRQHLDSKTPIACYFKGGYSHMLSADEFLDITQMAMGRLATLSLRFREPVEEGEERFHATGVHVFLDPEGKRHSVAVKLSFVKASGRWVIRAVDYGPWRERKRGKCPISSVAFGTQSEEVAFLSSFRDECLMRSLLGRWVVQVYYRLAPKAVPFLEDHPLVTKGLIRPGLNLMIWSIRTGRREDISSLGPALSGL